MKKKIAALTLAAALLAGTLAGCGQSQNSGGGTDGASTNQTEDTGTGEAEGNENAGQEQVELTLYQFQPGIVDQIDEICQEFNKEHPNIKVTADRPGDDYFNILKTMFASNQGPDIFSINAWTMVEDYAKSGHALDLSNEPFVDAVAEKSLESVSFDGKVYALPMESAAIGVLYNQDIFAKYNLEIPKTAAELEQVCAALEENGVTPFLTPVKETWMLRHLWSALHTPSVDIKEFTKQMNEGTGSFRNEQTEATFGVLDIIGKYSQENPFDDDYNTGCAKMGTGEAAMMVSGLWALDMIKQMDPEIKIGMFALPINDNEADTKLSVDNNSVYCINANSEHVEEAKIFLNWLAEKDTAQLYADKTKTVPVVKEATAYAGADPAVLDVMEYSMNGQTCPWGFSIWPTGFDEEAGVAVQRYLTGEATVDETIQTMDTKWAEYMSK